MGLRRKVDHAVDRVLLENPADFLEIADVCLDENIVRRILDILQIGQVAGIGQFVKVDNPVLGIFVDKKSYDMAADEAGTAGNKNVSLEFHGLIRML